MQLFGGVSKKSLHFSGARDCLLCGEPYISILYTHKYIVNGVGTLFEEKRGPETGDPREKLNR